MTEPIKFWKIYENGIKLPCGEYSNFARYPFDVGGVHYKTSEHYFQCMKFAPGPDRDEVLKANKPSDAAAIGRDRARPLRKDWEEVKDDVMYQAIKYKFEKYPKLQELLLSTGDREIIENSPIDSYWGCGADGLGKNMLGKLLMKLRTELRNEQTRIDT